MILTDLDSHADFKNSPACERREESRSCTPRTSMNTRVISGMKAFSTPDGEAVRVSKISNAFAAASSSRWVTACRTTSRSAGIACRNDCVAASLLSASPIEFRALSASSRTRGDGSDKAPKKMFWRTSKWALRSSMIVSTSTRNKRMATSRCAPSSLWEDAKRNVSSSSQLPSGTACFAILDTRDATDRRTGLVGSASSLSTRVCFRVSWISGPNLTQCLRTTCSSRTAAIWRAPAS
mmetsp:Transcript_17355/g.19432  ORF Transcript_17355/g.19432 Transcript_17355/m.19432 type:complete len:237 (-) Transcript_17355:109-819(-)